MIGTSAGASIAVCATATTANSQSALAALVYVDIGKVENLGELGPSTQDVSFTALNDFEAEHLSGASDNGALTITCGRDPLDAGQLALLAASATKFQYAVRLTEDDGTTTWIRGPVMNARKNVGGANDVTRRTFVIGLNAFFEGVSTPPVPGGGALDFSNPINSALIGAL